MILVAVLAGCYPSPPRNPVVSGPPGERAAVAIVEHSFFEWGLPAIDGRVSITWMSGACLDSPDSEAECPFGVVVRPGCDIYLLYRPTWAESLFAHEMLHCAIGDHDHSWRHWSVFEGEVMTALSAADL